jgi:PAS domain S-box-containing protein
VISHRAPTLRDAPDDFGALARLVALTGDLLCVLETDGIVRSAAGSLAVLGRKAAELVGENLIARVHPDEIVATRVRLDGLANDTAPIRFESRCRSEDGAYQWIAWCVAREKDRSFAAVLRDATERKWVEHEIEASLSLVEATLESTADGLLVADRSGHVVTFNRRFLGLWGITDAVIFSGPGEIDRFCEPLLVANADHFSMERELDEAREAERYEVLHLADGRVFERYSRPRQIGAVTEGRVWSFRDITERVRAERELHEHLNMGIEHAVEGIARIDEEGRYASVNTVFARMIGREENELVGVAIASLVHPDDHARVIAARTSVGDGKQEKQELELRGIHKDGSIVLLRALLVRAKGKDAGFHLFMRDITEQKEMEQRLLITDRMTSMGTLAAGVAHEINNPLSFVIANASVLDESLPSMTHLGEAKHAELKEIVSDIRDGAERVRRIVRDLKMFSRPDDTTSAAVDVRKVLESTVNMAWNEIRHRARLVKDYGEVPLVEANDGQLGQVFLNLLVNAAHAIPEGNVEKNEIRIVTSTDRDGRVVVEIRDTGAGIPERVLPRIFDPFFTTKPVGVGTGLGLSVCHGIVAKLGGDISVESTVGTGTTFRVRMRPAVERPKTVAPPAEITPRAEHRDQILVVDDEVMIGTSLRRILSRKHYDVAVCTGGREALDLLAKPSDFQIILCDMMMPDVSGMDVYEELMRTAPDIARRMVFMTGGVFTPRAKTFLDEVPNHRLEKPIDLPRLLEWMRDTLHPASG